jgi:ribosomal protein S18 acetylase RimI-like enzyme
MIIDRMSDKKTLCIEELSFNSWPALHSIHYDGWMLRLADGFTDRCNSVWPLYGSSLKVEDKVSRSESFYASKSQPSIFRITSDPGHRALDGYLNDRGYVVKTPTVVQTLDIGGVTRLSGIEEVKISRYPDDSWIRDVVDVMEFTGPTATYRAILENVVWPLGLARISDSGKVITLGLGVVEDRFLGMYGAHTRPSHRRQGWGRKLMMGLMKWGLSLGAELAYLHVEADNIPARTLYDSMGFVEAYRYWYRVKSVS